MDMSKAAIAAVFAAVLSAAPVAAQEDPIVFGGALCLTGVQAPLDTPGFRGAQVAVKALNDAGGLLGRPVEFINVDGKSDPVTVGNAAVELIDQGADLILAPCDFDFGGPASREAQTAGLVGLSLCASDPLYSSWSLGDKQFTLSMWNTTMGATAAEYAFKERGWKTAYVVTDQFIAYTKSLSKYFIEHFEALGGEILLEDTYTNGDNDFSAQLARLQALDKKPDVIFVSSYGQDIGVIIRVAARGRLRRAGDGRGRLRRPGDDRLARRDARQRHLLRDPHLDGAPRRTPTCRSSSTSTRRCSTSRRTRPSRPPAGMR